MSCQDGEISSTWIILCHELQGHFRRTLPRRQPLRFLLRLEGPPLGNQKATKAEVHQVPWTNGRWMDI